MTTTNTTASLAARSEFESLFPGEQEAFDFEIACLSDHAGCLPDCARACLDQAANAPQSSEYLTWLGSLLEAAGGYKRWLAGVAATELRAEVH